VAERRTSREELEEHRQNLRPSCTGGTRRRQPSEPSAVSGGAVAAAPSHITMPAGAEPTNRGVSRSPSWTKQRAVEWRGQLRGLANNHNHSPRMPWMSSAVAAANMLDVRRLRRAAVGRDVYD
jgi:hypothetical protein